MKKISTLVLLTLMCVANAVAAGSGIFLRGGVNNWGAPSEWEFQVVSTVTYVLENKELYGAFKVADATWTTINLGSNGATINLGESYTLGTKGNITIAGDATLVCSTITLIKNGTEYTFDFTQLSINSIYFVDKINKIKCFFTSRPPKGHLYFSFLSRFTRKMFMSIFKRKKNCRAVLQFLSFFI